MLKYIGDMEMLDRLPTPKLPGEALERQAQEQHFDWWLYLAGGATATVLLTISGWLSKIILGGRSPWDVTIAAGVFCIWLLISFRRNLGRVRQLLLGARGEREVGAILDDLRSKGYRVFHQVPIPLANGEFVASPDGHRTYAADHVIVGPAGIFVVETKRRSARGGKPVEVKYDFVGARVFVNNLEEDRCPLKQVNQYATGLGKYLRQRVGAGHFVRGVVLYPAARIAERRGSGANGRPWVLAPHRLKVWLRQEINRPEMSPGKVRLPMSESTIDRLATEIANLVRSAAPVQ